MVVAAASPSSTPPSAGRPHPTYKEMILQALTELRDPSGSSRRAIASYIADHFSGLHSSHDALLSVHLRRLRSQGLLRLATGNYSLSAAAPPRQQKRGPGRPPKPKAAAPGLKRGRGRPRKNPDLAPSAPIPIFTGPKRGPGRPRKNAYATALVPVVSSAPPVQGALALPPPSGVKRGRGRPRKNSLALVASSSTLMGAIAPSPSGVKRGRGRPRKNALALAVVSSSSPLPLSIAPPPASGVKRGRGRPRKNPYPVASPPPGVQQGAGGWTPSNTTTVSLLSAAMPRGGQHKPGQPPKGVLAMDVVPGSSVNTCASSNSVFGAKRGRGRPPKVAVAGKRKRGRPPKEKTQPESVRFGDAPLTKRRPGRPRKEKTLERGHLIAARNTGHEAPPTQAADHSGVVQDEVEAGRQTFDSSKNISVSSNGVFGAKRGRGRPPKEKTQPESVQSVDAPLTKRGPGRPRKEVTSEIGLLKAAQMADDGHEALPTQAADQAGDVQNEVEVRNLQSSGTSLTEKRGRGRPRKRPLETEPSETGVAVLVEKRGRGRPRKENQSAGTSASTGIKRGRGRPRKAKPFETGFAETAVEVSTDFTEGRPEKYGDLASGRKVETQGVLLIAGVDNGPAGTGGVQFSGEEVAVAPVDAGCLLFSGEEAAIAPRDAGGAMPGVDPVYSNAGTKSNSKNDST
ncbi:hypothetical protein BS78_10G083100 [Paspalum vaginatum]|nr:hypothetical protein BS78_10G083100 [Paspalum vaginatum]